jgi:SAM-dependent methyltransferase
MTSRPPGTFEQFYEQGYTPWEEGRPWPGLEEYASRFAPEGGRILDAGCGLGTQSIHLATLGYRVTGIDLVPLAIERARQHAIDAGVVVDFRVGDLVTGGIDESFDMAFDRGVFHSFEAARRDRWARTIRDALAPGGVWLSICGNADNRDPETGGPDTRPYPRISLTDVVSSCEPHFEIIEVTHQPFGAAGDAPRAWAVAMRRRP